MNETPESLSPEAASDFWRSATERFAAQRAALAAAKLRPVEAAAGDGLQQNGRVLSVDDSAGGQARKVPARLIVFAANGELAVGYAEVQNLTQVS